ncbi:MAG: right-handed parallel beta-helix repeat-containing protein [Phycisphaerales bacterium]
MRTVSLVTLAALGASSIAIAGPLTPPGAPAPSYRTLDQIDPGTPVSTLGGDANSVHSITSGGRYYLDGDIEGVGPGRYAIEVNTTEAVEIDFHGYSIRGDGTETLAAIDLNSGIAVVHGGAIAGWGVEAITENDSTLTLRRMTIRTSGGAFVMNVNRRTLIEDCVFETNAGPINLNGGGVGGTQTGIVIRGSVFSGMPSAISGPNTSGVQIIGCSFSGVGSASGETKVDIGSDALIQGCSFTGGGETAVSASSGLRMSDCVVRGLATGVVIPGIAAGLESSIVGCTVSGFSGDGVIVGSRSIVRDCSISNNGGFGINANASSVISGNALEINGGGIEASFGARVVGNTLRSHQTLGGIVVGSDAVVIDNTLDSGAIIVTGSDNVIDGNTITDTSPSIELNSTGNLVRRNTFSSGAPIGGTTGAPGNLVHTIRTSVDYLSAGPFDNVIY